MNLLAFALGELYIVCAGSRLLSLTAVAEMLAVIVISVLMSSTLVFFIVSFFYSQNAFSTTSSIIGTLIEFVTGIYLPIGTLPESAVRTSSDPGAGLPSRRKYKCNQKEHVALNLIQMRLPFLILSVAL